MISPSSCVLQLHVIPGAKQEGFCGMQGNLLKIKLRAPALDGRANAALLEFLSEALAIKKSALTLMRGEKNQKKQIAVMGLTQEEVVQRLKIISNQLS